MPANAAVTGSLPDLLQTKIPLTPDLACKRCAEKQTACVMAFEVPRNKSTGPPGEFLSWAKGCLTCSDTCSWSLTPDKYPRLITVINGLPRSRSPSGSRSSRERDSELEVASSPLSSLSGSTSSFSTAILSGSPPLDTNDAREPITTASPPNSPSVGTGINDGRESMESSPSTLRASTCQRKAKSKLATPLAPLDATSAAVPKTARRVSVIPRAQAQAEDEFVDAPNESEEVGRRQEAGCYALISQLADGQVMSLEQLVGVFGFFVMPDGQLAHRDIICDFCNSDKRKHCVFPITCCLPKNTNPSQAFRYCALGPAFGSRYGSLYDPGCVIWAASVPENRIGKNGPRKGKVLYAHPKWRLCTRHALTAEDKAMLAGHKGRLGPCGELRLGRAAKQTATLPSGTLTTGFSPPPAATPDTEEPSSSSTMDISGRSKPTETHGSDDGQPDCNAEVEFDTAIAKARQRLVDSTTRAVTRRLEAQHRLSLSEETRKSGELFSKLEDVKTRLHDRVSAHAAALKLASDLMQAKDDEIAQYRSKLQDCHRQEEENTAKQQGLEKKLSELTASKADLEATISLQARRLIARDKEITDLKTMNDALHATAAQSRQRVENDILEELQNFVQQKKRRLSNG